MNDKKHNKFSFFGTKTCKFQQAEFGLKRNGMEYGHGHTNTIHNTEEGSEIS